MVDLSIVSTVSTGQILMGKSTISTGQFSIAMLVYQTVMLSKDIPVFWLHSPFLLFQPRCFLQKSKVSRCYRLLFIPNKEKKVTQNPDNPQTYWLVLGGVHTRLCLLLLLLLLLLLSSSLLLLLLVFGYYCVVIICFVIIVFLCVLCFFFVLLFLFCLLLLLPVSLRSFVVHDSKKNRQVPNRRLM